MKRTKFSEMLESERIRLGHNQAEIAEWLFMTQSGYSRMEAGVTNPGTDRSIKIIEILETHGYEGIPPIELREAGDSYIVAMRWPFHRYGLYLIIAVLLLIVLEYLVGFPEDFARGFSEGYGGKEASGSATEGTIYLLLLIGAILYGFYRMYKKWSR